MTYFTECKTLEELKKLYHKLAMKHHPDMGGDEATMKAINAEFEARFEELNGEARKSTAATEEPTQDAAEAAREFEAVISKLVSLGLTVELCGRWLWISGDTKPVKEELKALHCRWASKKKLWYWHPADEPRKHSKRTISMQEIRSKYGSTTFKDERNAIAV